MGDAVPRATLVAIADNIETLRKLRGDQQAKQAEMIRACLAVIRRNAARYDETRHLSHTERKKWIAKNKAENRAAFEHLEGLAMMLEREAGFAYRKGRRIDISRHPAII